MSKNIKYSKTNNNLLILSLIFFSLLSCSKKDNLKNVYRIDKKVVTINNIGTSHPAIYILKDEEYSVIDEIEFDNLGKVSSVGHGFGVIKYKKPKEKQLPFDEEDLVYLNYKISLDKERNYIIDNGDTIKNFKKIEKDKILFYEDKKNERIHIYEYK